MSLQINIHLPDGDVSRSALDTHLDALGFSRGAASTWTREAAETLVSTIAGARKQHDPEPEGRTVGEAEALSTPPVPTTVIARERGKPAPGRARRTKEEIAEDEAAEKAEASGALASGTQQSISTGDERVGPEDDAETQAQDRADEEAEEAGNTEAAAPLTVMDGKAAIGVYLGKHGMEAAQADGMAIFVSALGEPPAGKAWGWTMLAEKGDQSLIDKAVRAWQAAATAGKRFGAA